MKKLLICKAIFLFRVRQRLTEAAIVIKMDMHEKLNTLGTHLLRIVMIILLLLSLVDSKEINKFLSVKV
jgi:hypothetical protein